MDLKKSFLLISILFLIFFINQAVVNASIDVNWCNSGGTCIGNLDQSQSIYPINDLNTFSYTINGSTSNPNDDLRVGESYQVNSTWCVSYISGMQMNLISQVGINVSEYGFLGSGDSCVYTAQNGNVLTGRKADIYVRFNITAQGVWYSRFGFYRSSGGFRVGFLNYNILRGAEINNNQNTQNIINNNNSNTDDIINNQNANTQKQIDNDNANTKKITDAQKATTDAINGIANTDIDSTSKQNPDTSDFDDYQNKEQQLFDKMNSADINQLNISIDGNSSNWVWETMTKLFATHSLINSFIITILSIGIIKMALGR